MNKYKTREQIEITKNLDIRLEERVCINGCGKSFRVLPSSHQQTARGNCTTICMSSSVPYEDRCRLNGIFFPNKKQLPKIKG